MQILALRKMRNRAFISYYVYAQLYRRRRRLKLLAGQLKIFKRSMYGNNPQVILIFYIQSNKYHT